MRGSENVPLGYGASARAAGPAACLPALPENHLPLTSAVKILFMLPQCFPFPNLDGSLSHFSTKMLKHFLKTSKQEET